MRSRRRTLQPIQPTASFAAARIRNALAEYAKSLLRPVSPARVAVVVDEIPVQPHGIRGLVRPLPTNGANEEHLGVLLIVRRPVLLCQTDTRLGFDTIASREGHFGVLQRAGSRSAASEREE